MQAIATGATIYPAYMEMNDTLLIGRLQNRNETAFEQVFKTYYKDLHSYAFTMLKDEAVAEEMVQNVFFKLWERAGSLQINGSIAAYLYRAVHNESLNYLKHLKVRTEHRMFVAHRKDAPEAPSRNLQLKELEERIAEALNDLPEQCRTVFQLSRFEELRYREIAERLDISVKTVENQMGKALKILRSKLSEYLTLLIIFLI